MSGGHNSLPVLALLSLMVLFCTVDSGQAELPIPPLAEVVHRDAEAIRGVYPGMLEAAQRRFVHRFHRAGFDGESLVRQDKTRLLLWTRYERGEEPERVFLHLSQREIGRTTFLLGHDPGEPEPGQTDPDEPPEVVEQPLTPATPSPSDTP